MLDLRGLIDLACRVLGCLVIMATCCTKHEKQIRQIAAAMTRAWRICKHQTREIVRRDFEGKMRLCTMQRNRKIEPMSVPSRGDGHLIQVTDPKSLEVGTVLRMINSDGSVAPFSDCIVRAVLPQAQDVRLLRPTFNGWSKRENDSPVGYEGFCATFEGVCKHFRIVTKASGAPYVMYG